MQLGVIGLGRMGANICRRLLRAGHDCVVHDTHPDAVSGLADEGATGAASIAEFVRRLTPPRNVWLMVPAAAVEPILTELATLLEPGDVVIDGGNSNHRDDIRRAGQLGAAGIHYVDVGTSGGVWGLEQGFCLMIGGEPAVVQRLDPIFRALAPGIAAAPRTPGRAGAGASEEQGYLHCGASGAGHFVKMVHNGIEYGLMQIISETFDFMQRVLKMDYAAMSKTFAEWNDSELNSFLVEITAEVLRKTDPDTGNPLVSMILDTAGQKGTGKWTSQAAMDFGIPIPTIDSAVSMRQISSQKAVRGNISQKYQNVHNSAIGSDSKQKMIAELKAALHCAFIVAYAQGMSMLQAASTENKYGLNLADIAKIWRGGCIIRSALLEEMRVAYAANPSLSNLLLDDKFASILDSNIEAWRSAISAFVSDGVPSMCFSSALAYFEAFRTERLPANLIQAQRDFFGAHTYQRIDKDEIFHTPDWEKPN